MRRRDAGSASIETVALVPVVLVVLVLALQVLVMAYTAHAADQDARDAARAYSLDASATQAAAASVPGAVRVVDVVTFGPDGITGHRDHRAVSAWTDRALRRVPAAPRLLHAAVTEAWVRRFGEFVEPMDDAGDAFVPCRDAELAVALELDGGLLDRKLAALRAQATQTAGLEAAVGADRYRASIAGEYFRPAATLFDGS